MPKSLLTLLTPYLKNGRTSPDNHHGTLDSNNFHFQPPSRFSSLLYFTQDFLPVKKLFLPVGDREERTSFVLQDLADYLLAVGFEMCLHIASF